VISDPLPADLGRERVRPIPEEALANGLRCWGRLFFGVGAAWYESTTGAEAICAVRLDFASKRSLVLALGERRDGAIGDIPDTVVATFYASIATLTIGSWLRASLREAMMSES
jgi:hypothetical protein